MFWFSLRNLNPLSSPLYILNAIAQDESDRCLRRLGRFPSSLPRSGAISSRIPMYSNSFINSPDNSYMTKYKRSSMRKPIDFDQHQRNPHLLHRSVSPSQPVYMRTGRKLPMTINGRLKRSRRTEKQKAQGTGLPLGPTTTHCVMTLGEVDSKACLAKDS